MEVSLASNGALKTEKVHKILYPRWIFVKTKAETQKVSTGKISPISFFPLLHCPFKSL